MLVYACYYFWPTEILKLGWILTQAFCHFILGEGKEEKMNIDMTEHLLWNNIPNIEMLSVLGALFLCTSSPVQSSFYLLLSA
jgi:hypothetical protein